MKLLVVVDMQNDFVTGILGNLYTQEVVNHVVNKVKQYIESGDSIIFTKDTHDKNYLKTREGKNLPVSHCIEGTTGHQLIPQLQELIDKYHACEVGSDGYRDQHDQIMILEKHDQFGLTHWEHVEDPYEYPDDESEFESIEVIGIVTNMCVISCAVTIQNSQTFKNVPIIIDANCCASNDLDLHNKALDVMEGLQMKVINR